MTATTEFVVSVVSCGVVCSFFNISVKFDRIYCTASSHGAAGGLSHFGLAVGVGWVRSTFFPYGFGAGTEEQID
ncbi:MAG: hypothetical protein EAZ23_26955 [Oscillatoriales cyanobacterium]|nr:MAG: hypothetical protein EAZ23_26955 [Oscillatoriales cyanobacterium]